MPIDTRDWYRAHHRELRAAEQQAHRKLAGWAVALAVALVWLWVM